MPKKQVYVCSVNSGVILICFNNYIENGNSYIDKNGNILYNPAERNIEVFLTLYYCK